MSKLINITTEELFKIDRRDDKETVSRIRKLLKKLQKESAKKMVLNKLDERALYRVVTKNGSDHLGATQIQGYNTAIKEQKDVYKKFIGEDYD